MTRQWVFIEAQDVWMFRDSKPFTAGESFVARSLFPPQPGTVQGMIRTHYYQRTGQIIGGSDSMGDLRVTGAFLARKTETSDAPERLYPLPLDVLTERERQVLHLAAEGHSNAEVAERLSIGVRTVETHRANMMRKLALKSQSELILHMVQRGFLE